VTPKGIRRRPPVTHYLTVGIFTSMLAFPFYWMFLTALKTNDDLYDPGNIPVILNDVPTLDHIRQLLRETLYLRWLGNTAFVGVAVAVITLGLALPAAYALARSPRRGVGRAGMALFLTYLVPQTLLLLPLSRIVSELGLHDSLWSLVVVYPTFTVPGSTWLLTGYLKSIPREIEDAALVDGCSRMRAFRSVVIPAATPGIVAVSLFSFALATNEFPYAATFITSAAHQTVSSGLPSVLLRGDTLAWGSLMAGVVGPSLLLAVLYSTLISRLLRWRENDANRYR
jgi:multiple sugar transport system permease protein